jgi:hypothetical protein
VHVRDEAPERGRRKGEGSVLLGHHAFAEEAVEVQHEASRAREHDEPVGRDLPGAGSARRRQARGVASAGCVRCSGKNPEFCGSARWRKARRRQGPWRAARGPNRVECKGGMRGPSERTDIKTMERPKTSVESPRCADLRSFGGVVERSVDRDTAGLVQHHEVRRRSNDSAGPISRDRDREAARMRVHSKVGVLRDDLLQRTGFGSNLEHAFAHLSNV